MNILTEKLPDYVTINGEKYPVYTDFKIWIKFDTIFEHTGEINEKTLFDVLKLCYVPPKLPPTWECALNGLFAFYCGKQKGDGNDKASGNRIYSFEYDAEYIYAAFLAQYGIDLTVSDRHWYRFKSLLWGLTDNHKICEIMSVRALDLSSLKDKEQRRHYKKLKELYALPDMRSESEKENDFAEALSRL